MGGFLASKGLYGHVGTIPHYSGRAAGSRGNEIKRTNREGEFLVFAGGIHPVPRNTCFPDHDCWPDPDPTEIEMSDSYKKLMFIYKIRFDRIRDQADGRYGRQGGAWSRARVGRRHSRGVLYS